MQISNRLKSVSFKIMAFSKKKKKNTTFQKKRNSNNIQRAETEMKMFLIKIKTLKV